MINSRSNPAQHWITITSPFKWTDVKCRPFLKRTFHIDRCIIWSAWYLKARWFQIFRRMSANHYVSDCSEINEVRILPYIFPKNISKSWFYEHRHESVYDKGEYKKTDLILPRRWRVERALFKPFFTLVRFLYAFVSQRFAQLHANNSTVNFKCFVRNFFFVYWDTLSLMALAIFRHFRTC